MPAPDGNGSFSSVGLPTLNDAGQLAFIGTLSNTSGGERSSDRFGVFRMEHDGSITQLARGLQTAPGGSEVFGPTFSTIPLLSGNGDVAFTASREGAVGTAGVYRGAPLTKMAERLQTAPDGNGSYGILGSISVNQAGQVAFAASLSGATPSSAGQGIYLADGATTVEIARTADPTPSGGGTFTWLSSPKVNEHGDVAFHAQTTISASPTGIFRGNGGVVSPIAWQGQPAPAWGGGTNGTYSTISGGLVFNDSGQAVFSAKLNGADDYSYAIVRSDGVDSTLVFAPGLPAPTSGGSASGTLAGFQPPSMNNRGEVITLATLAGTPGGTSDNRGIFVSDGATIRQVVRQGDPAPDGNGTLSISNSSTALVINDAGQTIFQSLHVGATAGTEHGIYFHDPQRGLMTVARTGQTIRGLPVTGLAIVESMLFQSPSEIERSGLNEQGQVAFRFSVAGGAQGLAVWTPPAPADFNDDGDIDGDDLATWGAHYGEGSATQFNGDASGDEVVDGTDFLIWQREVTGAPTFSSAAVPEPATWALACAAACIVFRRRVRRRRRL